MSLLNESSRINSLGQLLGCKEGSHCARVYCDYLPLQDWIFLFASHQNQEQKLAGSLTRPASGTQHQDSKI
uniref:Uncharacterized protein n=1 Tax=Lepeophtheirus salmonis TaxID=72036 RepID=A0A0K2V1V4_LEPSM